MNKRHPVNRNLVINKGGFYKNIPVWNNGDLIQNYLISIEQVLTQSLNEPPRTLAIRFDLRFPISFGIIDQIASLQTSHISSFFKNLDLEIQRDIKGKIKRNGNAHHSSLRYIWVKEQDSSCMPHYHVAIFLNKDTYYGLGSYQGNGDNMASRIIRAWAKAIGIETYDAGKCVEFPDNHTYRLNRNSENFAEDFKQLFFRVSYFAKVDTKAFGSKDNYFGCSRR